MNGKSKSNAITPPTRNNAEMSCVWCNRYGKCENKACEMNGLECDGAVPCNHYKCEFSSRKDKYYKPKKWHKVKTMFDTYLPNARYY